MKKTKFVESLEVLLSQRVDGLNNNELLKLVCVVSKDILFDTKKTTIECPGCEAKFNHELENDESICLISHPKRKKECEYSELIIYTGTVRSFRKGRRGRRYCGSEVNVARLYDVDGSERQLNFEYIQDGSDLKSKDLVMFIFGITNKSKHKKINSSGYFKNMTIGNEFMSANLSHDTLDSLQKNIK